MTSLVASINFQMPRKPKSIGKKINIYFYCQLLVDRLFFLVGTISGSDTKTKGKNVVQSLCNNNNINNKEKKKNTEMVKEEK